MKNLFVGNMSFQTSESELTELFQAYGAVTRVHVATDRETGRARGFAFIEMPNDEEANAAIAALNGKEVGGRALKVNEARPREPRSGPPSRSGGPPRSGGGGAGGGGGRGRGGYSSQDDYRDAPRQPREPRW